MLESIFVDYFDANNMVGCYTKKFMWISGGYRGDEEGFLNALMWDGFTAGVVIFNGQCST